MRETKTVPVTQEIEKKPSAMGKKMLNNLQSFPRGMECIDPLGLGVIDNKSLTFITASSASSASMLDKDSVNNDLRDIESKLRWIEEDREGAGTTHLYNFIQAVSTQASRAFEPLFERQAQAEKIRSVQGMLQRFRTLFNLPSTIRSSISKGEYDLAVRDYRKAKTIVLPSHVSVILRGANEYMLDEMDRSLHDAICIVKRALESNMVVAGGGAVEAALSVYLEYLATTLGSREQLAIAEFAESLLIIPKVLAVNAAKDATELVAKLRAYHHTAQIKADKQHLSRMGLDLYKGAVRNNVDAGVVEPAMSKVKIIQFATEAAITILRIDDMVKLVKDESQGED